MNQDEEHLKLLSIFHYIVGGMIAFFASIFVIHIIMGIVFMVVPFEGGDAPPALFGLIFIIVGSLVVLFGWTVGVCVIIAGKNLAKREHYTFCMVMAGVSCLFMPLGTILGVFTLVLLSRPAVKELFKVSQ